MMLVHLVAHTLRGSASLGAASVAPIVWAALRRAFPDALACVLMPEHLLAERRQTSHLQRSGCQERRTCYTLAVE